jgi:hypothetical protein
VSSIASEKEKEIGAWLVSVGLASNGEGEECEECGE